MLSSRVQILDGLYLLQPFSKLQLQNIWNKHFYIYCKLVFRVDPKKSAANLIMVPVEVACLFLFCCLILSRF